MPAIRSGPPARPDRAFRKASRRPDASDRLRGLARRVERLGIGGRTDPEEVTVNKLTVAAELRA